MITTKLFTTLAAAVGLTTAATAATRMTPSVIWDGDFDTPSKTVGDVTYTLNLGNNTVDADGKLTIADVESGYATGAYIDYGENSSFDGVTVIIKYSNLAKITDRLACLGGVCAKSVDVVMAHSSENNSLALTSHWSGSATAYPIGNSPSLAEGSGYLVISYRASNNTYIFAGSSLASLTGGSCGLKFTNYYPQGVNIGGARKVDGTYKINPWSGAKIEAVAIFRENNNQSTSASDFADYKFPSECGDTVKKGATWGNIGDAENGGIATGIDKMSFDVDAKSYTLNFSDTSSICTTGIGTNGYVVMSKVRLAACPDDADIPASITLSQTDGPTITSYACDSSTKVNIYKSNKDSIGERTCAEYSFAPTACFDTSKAITVTYNRTSGSKVGMTAIKPGNVTFAGSTDSWSPAYEFIGDYYFNKGIISVNIAQYWSASGSTTSSPTILGQVSGDQTTLLGTIPEAAWAQACATTIPTVTSSGHNFSFPVNKYVVNSAVVDNPGTTTVSGYYGAGTNLKYDGTVGSYSYAFLTALNCNQGDATLSVTGIPFETYDVIIYLKSVTGVSGKRQDKTMAPVKVGETYLYPTAVEGINTEASGETSPYWGDGTASTWTYGTNVMRVNGLSGDLALAQKVQNYGIAAIQIIESVYETPTYTATVSGDVKFSEIDTWEPSRPSGGFSAEAELTINNTAAATVTFDEAVNVAKIVVENESGNALGLALDETVNAKWDFSGAAGGISFASLDGTELAKNAVAGAPYSYWAISGTVSGTPAVTCPEMPNGYTITSETLANYGIRLIVTAPDKAQFGAVSMNIHNGTALTGDGNHGLYPVALADWGNIQVGNDRTVTYSGLTFTMSSSVSGYGINNTPPDMIQKQYMDDNNAGVTRTISVSGMTAKGFAEYRAIVYYSTDSANIKFAPLSVTEGSTTTWYAGPTAGSTTVGYTVKGNQSVWGHTGANHNANALGEGVNALVTDVMTADSITLNFLKKDGQRATPCAIQIVAVGDYIRAYTATVTEDADFSALDWSPAKPAGGFPEGSDFELNNTGSGDTTTVTMDSAVNAGQVTVTGASKTLKLAGASNLTATTLEAGENATLLVSGTPVSVANLTIQGAGTVEFEDALTFASGKTLTVNGTLTGGFTFNSGATLTFGTSGALVIPSGKTVDWQNGFDKDMFRALHNKTSGDGWLKIAYGSVSSDKELHFSGNTALTANVNIEFTGAGPIILVGTLADSDTYTVAAGKTVKAEDATIWPKRNNLIVNGTLIANYIKVGHEAGGNYPGKLTINDGGIVKTKSVTFCNAGGSDVEANRSVLALNAGGILEFTQNDAAAITKTSGAKNAVKFNGGTIRAEDSSWYVDSDIAVTLGGDITFDVAAEKTITVKGEISGTGNVAITGAGKAVLSGANDYGTGLVTIGENASLQLVLTAAQIESATTVFKSSQEAEYLNARVTAVNEAGTAIPGVVTKGDDNAVIFTPAVEFYTLEMADGQTYNWNGNIWTKGGESGLPYAPASGKVGDVTITVNGSATLTMTGTPASLGGVKFEKADGASTAVVTVKYMPTDATLPTSSAVNVTYNVFGMLPTVGDGVTYTFDAALDAAKYAWECSQSAGTFFATKRPTMGSINLKIGPRGTDLGYISTSLESVGANPLSGLLWTNAKIYTDTTQRDPGYTDLGHISDANGSDRQVRYAFRGPNTYWSGSDSSTGNAILLKTYVDDGDQAASRTWTITNANDETDIAVLPAAQNARGWQIHLDNLPYAAFDLYFITASDQKEASLKQTPIKLSADGGATWVSYTGDTENHTTITGDTNWKGQPWTSGTLTEGLNYLKMRVSAEIMSVEKITSLEITHGARDTGSCIRSGLAAIQIVELENDGVFKLEEDNGNWTTGAIWSSGGVAGKTWDNGGAAIAKITSSDTIKSVTLDAAVSAEQVVLTGDGDFTVNGTGSMAATHGFDMSKFWGRLTMNAPVGGEYVIASGKFTLNNAAATVTLGGTASNVVVNAGTLKFSSKSVVVNDSDITVAGGTLDLNGLDIQHAYTLSGGSIVNNGGSIGTGAAQMNGLTVTGNATVGGSGDFGLLAWQYGATTLNLGANTLTKTGENSFWLCNTTIEGKGTIQVDEGTLAVDSATAKDASFAEGTISVGASGSLRIANNRTLTVSNVTLAAANGVTANGTLKLTGTLDATAAGATVDKLTFSGTPTVKLTAAPLAITTLAFGTDATTVNLDFTGAPFDDWTTAGVTATQMVTVASFPAARLGTVTGVAAGWYVDITATGITLNRGDTPATESEISDQTDLGSVYVPGTLTVSGTGGALATSLALAPSAKLTLDPVRTPLKVSAKPSFKSGAKIALASAYAETTLGKLTLISWVGGSLGLDSEGLKALVDATTFGSATYTVEETGTDSLRQLVLKIGDYDASATEISIAQFGDSITEGIIRSGYRGTPNYRIPLMQMLEAKGYKPEARGFRMVGSTDANGVAAPDTYAWHTGISGQRIYTGKGSGNLRAGFMESLEAHLEQVGVTDVITLKIGTNDANGDETAEHMYEGMTNLVWKIVNMRPTSKIFFCSPIPILNKPANDPILKQASDWMQAYIEAGTFGSNVFFIDGHGSVPAESAYYLSDSLHPNWKGHMLLADAFASGITAQFTSESPRATASYVAKETRTAEANVPNEYRSGYVKLLTFTNVADKSSAWTGGMPYTYTNTALIAKKFDRIAYYVERKTSASPDTRFVWVDMDAAEIGRSVTDFCIPTNVQKHLVVKNLHVYSNSSAIENVEPTVSGVNGTVMLTSKGCGKAGSLTDAPESVFDFDWNDTLNNNAAWGIMTVSRAFADRTRTTHRVATEAQVLFGFNGYNLTSQGNAFGIGDFAAHGLQSTGNSCVGSFTLSWIFAASGGYYPRMSTENIDYGVIEIWAKQGPEGAVTAEVTDAAANWSQLEWTDESGDKFTNLTGAFNYTLTGTGTTTLDAALASGATVTVSGGTLKLANADYIGTPTYTVNAGATLLVTASGLTASKVTNNGTIRFEGGDATNPIEITGNANFGFVSLGADTYVKNTVDDNHVHVVKGEGATSCYALNRTDGGVGFESAAFTNLTIVSDCENGRIWVERMTYEDIRFVANKTIHLNGVSPTVLSLTGTNSVTRAGSETLTITCEADAEFEGASTVPFTIGAGDGVQTLSGNYTGALTVNAGGKAALKVGAGYALNVNNAGTLRLIDNETAKTALTSATFDNSGTLDLSGTGIDTISIGTLTAFGTVTWPAGVAGTVKLTGGTTRDYAAITALLGGYAGAVEIAITETQAENGAGKVALTGAPAGAKIVLTRIDGSVVEGTATAEGAFTQDVTVLAHGAACYYDFTFTNTIATAGGSRETYTLQHEIDPVYSATEDALLLYCSPWNQMNEKMYNLSTFSVAMYGKVSATNNTFFIAFGSAASDPKGMLFLATNEDGSKVNVVYYDADGTLNTLSQIVVPNMTTASHLYVFSKVDARTLDIYLDGALWERVTSTVDLVMGSASHSGVQFGSGFGARPSPYIRVPSTDTTADVGALRIYDYVVTAKQLAALKTEFPYESPDTFARTVDTATTNWVSTGAWTKGGETFDAPAANGAVKVTAEADTTVSVNLGTETAVNYEKVTFAGTQPIKLALAQDNTIPLAMMQAEIETPLTVTPDAVDLLSVQAMSIGANGKLTVDLSSIDCGAYTTNFVKEITGTCTDGTLVEQGKLAIVKPTEMYGRDMTIIYQANMKYAVEVTLDDDVTAMYWKPTETVLTNTTHLTDAEGTADYIWWQTMPITVGQDNTAALTSITGDCANTTFLVNEGVAFDIGTVRNARIGGTGSVKAQLSGDYEPGDVVSIFTVASGTPAISQLRDKNGTAIDPTYYTVANGTVTFKKEAAKGTIYYFTLKQAVEEQTGSATIELVADITDVEAITVGQAITLEGGTNILSGASFALDGGTLVIASGCIGFGYADGIQLAGGRFTKTSKETWESHLLTGHAISQLAAAVRPDYDWQLVDSKFVPEAGETLIPVKNPDGSDAGAMKLDAEWVSDKGEGDTPEAKIADLNTAQSNGQTKLTNEILGLDGDDEESKPVVAPVQTVTPDAITFKLGGVNVDTDSGATVTYKVYGSTDKSSWTAASGETAYNATASVELPSFGVKYYKFEVITATSK